MLVTAWWDLNRQFQPGHTPRRRRVRPLKMLERELGHRLRMEGFSRFAAMPSDLYQYEAYNWLEADNIDAAVNFVLMQLCEFRQPLSYYHNQLNRAAFDDPNWDGSVIGSFYWNTEQQAPLDTLGSGGVLLSVTPERDNRRRSKFFDKVRSPIISVPRADGPRADYTLTSN